MKLLARLLKWIGISIFCLSIFIFGLAFYFDETMSEELLRTSNPSKTVDAAVLWEGGGGAAGWSVRTLNVMPAGTFLKDGKYAGSESLSNFHLLRPEVVVTWKSDHELLVQACIDSKDDLKRVGDQAIEIERAKLNDHEIVAQIVYEVCKKPG